jgi:ATP-binding cassette subfamily B protein
MLRAIPLVFKTSPGHNIADILMGILHGVLFAMTVIATQRLFDTIYNAATGNVGYKECVISLLILAGVTFGQQIINGVHDFHGFDFVWPKATGKLLAMIHLKIQRIDPAQFENTDFLDDLNKAKEGAKEITLVCMVPLVCVTFYGIYFATMGAYLFNLKPMLLFTLILAFIPAMLSQVVRVKVFTKLEQESAPLRRKFDYYHKTLCDREYFKETRILGAFQFFYKLFSETLILLTRKQWQAERATALLQLMLNVTSFVGMGVATYMLFTATMAGGITIGAFAAVFAALGELFNLMQTVINTHISNMNKNVGKVTNFLRLIDMPERVGVDGTPDFTKGVVAEGVCFTYPGREGFAVEDLSLTIADGETVAIVGENGAGKSTLVRLLTGIYRPVTGKVTVGGLYTARIVPASLHQGTSGVFQKYQRYKMTLEENVTISDADKENDKMKVKAALEQSNVELDVELGMMLSPEFDGIDLSGGQWQRVAIARGLYRVNSFIVLDEPTSAIDPIEETLIYQQFQRLASGKCAVVVTHRLGSAKLAQRIIVMDGGRIIDMGTHDELLARPGKYADMWEAQTQWYEREENL